MKCTSCGNNVSLLRNFSELPKYKDDGEKIRLCHECLLAIFRVTINQPMLAAGITDTDLEQLDKSLKWVKENKDKIEEAIKNDEA